MFIDVHAGMPTFWTLAEGPPIVIFGVLVLYLSIEARLKPHAQRNLDHDE